MIDALGQLVAAASMSSRRSSPNSGAVQAYMNAETKSGLSPYTVRNHHSVLRRALGQAERWGLVPRNVARLVSPPRIPHDEVRPLNPEQARRFLDAIEGHRLAPVFEVALSLGLRQGEILGLTWDAVDIEGAALRVDRSLQHYRGEFHLDEVKTARSRRVLGLPLPLAQALKAHRGAQLRERMRLGPAWQGNDWELVFTTEFGAPLSGKAVRRLFVETLEQAGLPRQRFHDLRHCAASFMLAQGVPLKVAQEVLGHSTIAITADTYAHLTPAATRDATERVGELLWAGPRGSRLRQRRGAPNRVPLARVSDDSVQKR